MTKYRSDLEQRLAALESIGLKPLTITNISHRTNIGYVRLRPILEEYVNFGIIEKLTTDTRIKYVLTDKGQKVVKAANQIKDVLIVLGDNEDKIRHLLKTKETTIRALVAKAVEQEQKIIKEKTPKHK